MLIADAPALILALEPLLSSLLSVLYSCLKEGEEREREKVSKLKYMLNLSRIVKIGGLEQDCRYRF